MEMLLGAVDEQHVIYDQDTLRLHATFPTRKAALARMRKIERREERMAERHNHKSINYKLAPKGYYDLLAPKTKMVRNMMTGNLVEIDFNAPASCDPSTETYWSM